MSLPDPTPQQAKWIYRSSIVLGAGIGGVIAAIYSVPILLMFAACGLCAIAGVTRGMYDW